MNHRERIGQNHLFGSSKIMTAWNEDSFEKTGKDKQ